MNHLIASRTQQAKKIITVIMDYLDGLQMDAFSCIEVGCGSGEISAYFGDFVAKMWGIELEFSNFPFAQASQKKNFAFSQADGAKLPFSDQVFDLVLFPQVYEHTTKQKEVFNEIYRVLKPGGICFFSGPNRFQIIEPHYFLPFLSWLPHKLSDLYLRLTQKGDIFDIYPRNYWYIKRLAKSFTRIDYTHKMIANPEKYGLQTKKLNKIIIKIPLELIKCLAPFYPNYNWLLIKQNSTRTR
ncbi:MAG TPA: class I SAM-dependent methyltransferase [Brevefilum sp.]|nr:class I SAM-dependent methyltransferase [Brevefilum sp.]HOR19935.1 class I SAM-dependent methyltransferase [Brevefilum sp.]HPL69578.1 class I SAM-dependent methyltransferase [Brevefilum sp.]